MGGIGKKLTAFQASILVMFGIFAVAGLIVFATFSAKNDTEDFGRVIVWGTISQNTMNNILSDLRNQDRRFKKVFYAEKDKRKFYELVTDALAAGEGPDVILIDPFMLNKYKNKIYAVPYEYYSEREFRDRFIDGAEIFLSKEGVLAFPFAADPLVLYWNRDIFAENAYTEPPKLWKQVVTTAKNISRKDEANNIEVSAIALGAYENIAHAKEILSTLFMQIGSNITNYNYKTNKLSVGIAGQKGARQATKALRFYTSFANPVNNIYSWNRGLDNSLDLFVQDRLAMYIGYASDLNLILNKNPHLNFDVAELPQVDSDDNQKKNRVYAKYYGFAITKSSKNKIGSFVFARTITHDKYAKILSNNLSISPVSRALLSEAKEDALQEVFRKSTIISRSFIDPDPRKTDDILSDMVRAVISGELLPSGAIARAAGRLSDLLYK